MVVGMRCDFLLLRKLNGVIKYDKRRSEGLSAITLLKRKTVWIFVCILSLDGG